MFLAICIISTISSSATSEVAIQSPTIVNGTVCIDAGHGGSDTGAISADSSTMEKDDNLKLALKVQEYLEQMNLTVIMTRTDDTTVELNERCRIANDANADLFVSLHRNSAEDISAHGIEVWVHNSRPNVDVELANNILNGLESVGIQENRGVKFGYRGDPTQNYRINRLTNMPSCLVETGFISNQQDRELFEINLDEYARAIAEAIYQTLEDVTSGVLIGASN